MRKGDLVPKIPHWMIIQEIILGISPTCQRLAVVFNREARILLVGSTLLSTLAVGIFLGEYLGTPIATEYE